MNVFVIGQRDIHFSIVGGFGEVSDAKQGHLQVHDVWSLLNHLFHVLVDGIDLGVLVLSPLISLDQVEACEDLALHIAFAVDNVVVLRPLVKVVKHGDDGDEELADHNLILALIEALFD